MTSSIPHGGRSTANQVLAGVDLTRKWILITGCDEEIGFETMNALAANGAHVFGLASSLASAKSACDEIGPRNARRVRVPRAAGAIDGGGRGADRLSKILYQHGGTSYVHVLTGENNEFAAELNLGKLSSTSGLRWSSFTTLWAGLAVSRGDTSLSMEAIVSNDICHREIEATQVERPELLSTHARFIRGDAQCLFSRARG
jgi:hypothetical protein